MKMIVNADDFGLTAGVTCGICDCILNGIVSSTTMMVNTPGTTLAARIAKKYPFFNIGLHLNISLGRPLTDCPSLTGENLYFIKPSILQSDGRYNEDEIYSEFKAQYIRFTELTGKKPTHADTHLYAHQIFPKVKRQIIRLSEEMEIPVRDCENKYYKAVYFEKNFKTAAAQTPEELIVKFKELVKQNLSREYIEFMAHPGFIDKDLLDISSYNLARASEAWVLKTEQAAEFIRLNNIELTGYNNLKRKD